MSIVTRAWEQVQRMWTPGQPDPSAPPKLSGSLPLLGNIVSFGRDPIELLRKGQAAHGEVFRFQLFQDPCYFLSGVEAQKAYFNAPDDVFSAKEAYQLMTPIFGKGIVYDCEPSLMNEQLGFLYPALAKRRMQTYAEYMCEEATQYIAGWGDEGEVDMLKVTTELTTFISSRCLLGYEIRKHFTDEFVHLYKDLEKALTPIAYFFPNLPLPKFKRRDEARAEIVKLISRIIEGRRASGDTHPDFLQTLMEARYKDGRALTDDEIAGLLLTVVFAGHHTSSVLSAWTGLLLFKHPQFVPALLDEQRQVFGGGRPMDFESLGELPTLERAIKEAERMHPPLVLLMRKVMKDYRFKDHTIPAGSLAMVSPAVAHRLAEVFPDPNTYDPDRFAPPRSEDSRHFTLIGFGGGKHRCIGLHFAYMQIKALWSVLLQNFEFELSQPHDSYQPNYDFMVVGPRQPCNVRYRRRKLL
jgi:sterol 14-demethylase